MASFANTQELLHRLEHADSRVYGVKQLGFGSAYTAFAQGEAGLFYNPAGLAFRGQSLSYENLDMDANQHNLNNYFAAHLSPFGLAFWQQENQGVKTQATVFGFGNYGTQGVGWGLNLKLLSAKTQSLHKSGTALDFGVQLRLLESLRVGAFLKNIYTTGLDLSAIYRLGLAYKPFDRLRLVSDVVQKSDGFGSHKVYVQGGVDVDVSKSLSMSAGYFDEGPTLGIALKNEAFQLHYAIVDAFDSKEPYRQSFGIRLGLENAWQGLPRRHTVKNPKAYAEFHLNDNLISGQSSLSLFGGEKIGLSDLVRVLNDLSKDRSAKGIVIKLDSFVSNLASLGIIQELRQALINVKNQDKEVIIYVSSSAGLAEYYLASVASKLVMAPMGSLSQLGLEFEVLKTKRFLKRFGFETEVISHGRNKAALSESSDALTIKQKHLVDTLLRDLYHEVILSIKQDRNLDWKRVADVFDGRLIAAQDALDLGLVDELLYYDELKESLNEDKANKFEDLSMFVAPDEPSTVFSFQKKIAVLEIDGPIHTGKSLRDGVYGEKKSGADDISASIQKISKDASIKGVLLRINTPGGSVLGSDQIYRALEQLADEKTVYVSMGNMATSGGYYVALPAKKLYASETTLTGSIGVLSMYSNWEGFFDWLNIDVERFSTGKKMGLYSNTKRLSKAQKEMIKSFQNSSYKHFRELVKTHRNLDDKTLDTVAQGHLFTGKQALKVGLIDELGGYQKALTDLALSVGLSKHPKVKYYRKGIEMTLPLQSPPGIPFLQNLNLRPHNRKSQSF